MNTNLFQNGFACGLRFAAGLAIVIVLGLPSRSLAEEGSTPGRYLLIFDTSWGMKKRAAAVEATVSTMLTTSLGSQLQPGDTIGAWTFNHVLQPGDFPLQVWNPDRAVMVATNLTRFLKSRKYENNTSFEALQPMLNRVVRGSERLTVMIFCDGATKIVGTTFDNGINQLFKTNLTAQKKARQPFVVVLRSQQGKFVGCTVSYPPQVVSFPQFPPLPEPPPKPKTQVAVPPVVVTPSLLITGKKVELLTPAVTNDLPASLPPANPSPVLEAAPALAAPTNAAIIAPEVAPIIATLAPSNPPAIVVEANPVLPAISLVAEPASATPGPSHPPTNLTANLTTPIVAPVNAPSLPTNTILAAAEKPAAKDKIRLLLGVIVLLVAGMVTLVFMTRRNRSDHGSLISRSLDDR